MSEDKIIQHCSPTLAGMKTGALFNHCYGSIEEMREAMRLWNRRLNGKGLRVLPLRYREQRALIYLYRPSRLSRDLRDKTARRLLQERGYAPEAPDTCVAYLAKRVHSSGEFPHEIGLFLGYPPEDVCGFIENRAANCKCVGCWKVYGDAERAQKTFARYKRCTEAYQKQHAKGKNVQWLAVAE